MSMMTESFAPWMRDLNRLFTPDAAPATFIPPGDLIITDEGVTVYMDVPGVPRENLEIELENDMVTIRGERPFPYPQDDRAVRRIERRFGRFERSMRVPSGCQIEDIQASLSDGVLTVSIPRPAEQRPRRVEIQTGARTPADVDGSATETTPAEGTATETTPAESAS
jgi:HSP20 family protein